MIHFMLFQDTVEPADTTEDRSLIESRPQTLTPTTTNLNDITITNLEDAESSHTNLGFKGTNTGAQIPPSSTSDYSERPKQESKQLERQDSKVKRVRFDLTDDLSTSTADEVDDNKLERQGSTSDQVPDLLYSAYNYEIQQSKNENTDNVTDVRSPESSSTDNQAERVLSSAQDDSPIEREMNGEEVDEDWNPTRIKYIHNDIEVTSL